MSDKDTLMLLTLTCNNPECLLRVRVGRLLSKPALQVGGFKFCPLCGGKANALQDNDEDYWETMGKAYNLQPEVMRMLYDTWPTNEFHKFRDYVASIYEEIEEDKVK